MDPAEKKATYEDLLAVPDRFVAELVAGELHTSPRPAGPHAHAASTLGMDLGSAFQRGRGGPGGWWIVDEPELHFGADVLVPDLAGWRIEQAPSDLSAAYFERAPAWVCEVVSPSTGRHDRVGKLPVYARAGVSWAWLVDPLQETLEVFERRDASWLLASAFGGDDAVRAAPFDAIELELSALWLRNFPRRGS